MNKLHEAPLVTFALFAYNQQEYIREAVEAVLAQDYQPLEIIISDDCSSDQTLSIVTEIVSRYSGPHEIIVNANKKNLGLIGHVNKIARMSSGELIVVGAGDDISHPFRASELAKIFFASTKRPLLIHSSAEKISEKGRPLGIATPPIRARSPSPNEALTLDSVYIGATGAWNRKLFELFGPITHLAAYEDIVLGVRAAMLGGLVYCPASLLKYRIGTGIATGNKKFSSLRSFFLWRKEWLKTMQHVYLQRKEDSDSLDTALGKSAMMKKLHLYTQRKELYENGWLSKSRISSNPILWVESTTLEISSIARALVGRIFLLIKYAVVRH